MDEAALKASRARSPRGRGPALLRLLHPCRRDPHPQPRPLLPRQQGPEEAGRLLGALRSPRRMRHLLRPRTGSARNNPNVEEVRGKERRQPNPAARAAAEGDERIAARTRRRGLGRRAAALRRDVENIPEAPRPEHVLPPPRPTRPARSWTSRPAPDATITPTSSPSPSSEKGGGTQDYGSAVHAYIEGGMRGDPRRPAGANGNGPSAAIPGASTYEYGRGPRVSFVRGPSRRRGSCADGRGLLRPPDRGQRSGDASTPSSSTRTAPSTSSTGRPATPTRATKLACNSRSTPSLRIGCGASSPRDASRLRLRPWRQMWR